MRKENIVLTLLIAMLGLMIWNVIITKEVADTFPNHDQLRACRMFLGFGIMGILQGIALLTEKRKSFILNGYFILLNGIALVVAYFFIRNWYIVHGY